MPDGHSISGEKIQCMWEKEGKGKIICMRRGGLHDHHEQKAEALAIKDFTLDWLV